MNTEQMRRTYEEILWLCADVLEYTSDNRLEVSISHAINFSCQNYIDMCRLHQALVECNTVQAKYMTLCIYYNKSVLAAELSDANC